ncbi:type I-E CRISPR-associated protein Cse1/CasA [Stappia sp.]|uniref:type I-E CRISPR-associated protein Cse1/CasA n=1 Tax=Stappia sp. TaxID=1870903 RepID=UPI003D0E98B7
MTFNLLSDRMFPVVMRGGGRVWLSFPELAAGRTADDEYALDFDWGRPDLDTASFELCIGICQLAFDIRNGDDWRLLWTASLSAEAIAGKIEPLLSAFVLDGDGPRFLQDLEPFEVLAKEADINAIEALFIDTPGQNGQKKNADLLTHRDRFAGLGLPAAAMALYALQAFAPAGGAGNRTSMRGGGPLTALVMPTAADGEAPVSLWRKILANVCYADRVKPGNLETVLPWLSPTLTSGKEAGGRMINPARDGAAHPLQAFFGMPRRLRLVFADAPGTCALTGTKGPVAVGFVQRPFGVNYGIWRHPLTPYRRQKEGAEPYSAKPKTGRFGYRDWVSVTIGQQEGLLADMAETVACARRERGGALLSCGADPRIRVAGWAMNNMEAVAYLFSEQPLHLAPTAAKAELLEKTARDLARSADLALSALRDALRRGLFGPAGADGDKGVLSQAQTAFYEQTDAAFHELLDRLLVDAGGKDDAGRAIADGSRRAWLSRLRRTALRLFDQLVPVPVDDFEKAEPIVAAYQGLALTLSGYGKVGARLFAELELPVPEKRQRTGQEEREEA